MAYKGYLIKVGDKEIPIKYMAESSYYATPFQRQDLDSYRDNTGELHRDVVEHKPSKVEFKTMDSLSEEEFHLIWSIFKTQCTSWKELKANVEFYDPLTGLYSTEQMYLKNPKVQIDYIDKETNTVYFKSTQFILTGY